MSIQKKNGLYYPVIYDRKQKKPVWFTGFKKKKDAEREERRIRELQDRDKIILCNAETFNSVFEEWKELVAPEVYTSRKSLETAVGNIKNRCVPEFGECTIDKISTQDIQKFFHRMKNMRTGTPLSDATKKKLMGSLNSIFNSAISWGYLIDNPCQGVKLKSPKSPPMSIWSGEDIFYFFNLKNVKESEFYLPLLILATTGMRRGEVCGLRWKNFDNECLNLTEGMDVYGDATDMKTDGSHRSIVLMDITKKAIEKQKIRQHQIALMLGDSSPILKTTKPWDYICTDDFNQVIRPDRLSRNFKKLINQNNKETNHPLEVIKLKELRHSFASFALANGENIKIISEILGHSRTSTTYDFYIGAMQTLQRDTVSRIEDRMLKNINVV